MQFHVVIKGTRFEAARAAADRGIPLAFKSEIRDATTTTQGIVNSSVSELNSWLCEDREAPFPIGSLLYWTTLAPAPDERETFADAREGE